MRSFWILVERSRLIIFLTALAAPFLGARIGAVTRRKIRARRPLLGGVTLGVGVAGGVMLMPVLLFMSMCLPPVGRGIASEAWYRRAEPAIVALRRYHEEVGRYPDSLAVLVPHYLAADRLSEIRRAAGEPLEYKTDRSSYELTFRYYGPGSNTCAYRPTRAEWRCSGAF